MNRKDWMCETVFYGVAIRNGGLSSFATLAYFDRLLIISQYGN